MSGNFWTTQFVFLLITWLYDSFALLNHCCGSQGCLSLGRYMCFSKLVVRMKVHISCIVVLLCARIHGDNRLLNLNSVDEYLDVCMDGISHKQTPGTESSLFSQCEPWKDRSCCTKEISESLHVNESWYKLDWNHCNKGLSAKCRGRFLQDLCFYECSPNVGPWLVKVDGMKIRKERFVDVPLCRQECDAWWEDCKEDFTCVENWSRGFDWSSGFAVCPTGKPCVTIEQMFKNSTNFCERVWDHSWKVVEDNYPGGCFLMWWEKNGENPNRKVAEYTAEHIVSIATTLAIRVSLVFLSSFVFFFSGLKHLL